MNLVSMQSALRIDLADDNWDAFELSRGVIKAVADLTRFLPDEKIAEYTLICEVTAEPWTSADAHGTYKALANKPIKYESETVQSSDLATTYTRDTDYYMDYSNGEITTIDGGSMAVTTAYKIGYTKCREAVDISALTDIVRVQRVEYPMSTDAEFEFITYAVWGTVLYIAPAQYTANKHIVVYYEAECVAPTSLANGSYPGYLDEVILKGAAAYALMSRGVAAAHAAKSIADNANTVTGTLDKTDAETALGNVAGRIIAATTALGKVTSEASAIGTALGGIATYLAGADAALSNVTTPVGDAGAALDKVATCADEAKVALNKVATEVEKAGSGSGQDMENVNTLLADAATSLSSVATRITAMQTALDEMADMWTDEVAFRTAAKTYLESGDDYINKVNVGDRVADLYGTYAQIQAALARLSESRGTNKLTEASTQLAAAAQYIGEANSRVNIVNGYILEAGERIGQARAYVEEATGRLITADRHISEANGRMGMADSYISEAGGRIGVADRHIGEAGGRVALADRFISEASGWVALADRKVADANTRLGLISNYINEANINMSQASGYITEANGRLACQDLMVKQAGTYSAIATQQTDIAKNYLEQAIERRNEFWSVLKDKSQWRKELSLMSQRQSP